MGVTMEQGLLFLLSPAKTLDMDPPPPAYTKLGLTKPYFTGEKVDTLLAACRKLSKDKLQSTMGLSASLADLNHKRFADGKFDGKSGKQAVIAFNGPAYQGLDAASLPPKSIKYLQDSLVILCGLYGTLRPLDAIEPYRLEMGSKVAAGSAKDLYGYWKDDISKHLADRLARRNPPQRVIVNVASTEYSKAVDPKKAGGRFVTCIFKDDGRIVAVYAKRARGLLVRYAALNEVTDVDQLRNFDLEGYRLDAKQSSKDSFVFTRGKAAAEAAKKRTREDDEDVEEGKKKKPSPAAKKSSPKRKTSPKKKSSPKRKTSPKKKSSPKKKTSPKKKPAAKKATKKSE